MRTIFVIFDSLNRHALGAYGGDVPTPNFDRFAQKAAVFDRHYAGSLPCMPARRDMHTGRVNFTHRPWGPLEPYDNSYARILSGAGVYTHLITDHLHYFENGGWGYAQAFDSWDFVRGQEYDPVRPVVVPPVARMSEGFDERHYPTNGLQEGQTATRWTLPKDVWKRSRHALNSLEPMAEDDHPTSRCFARAFDFLETNRGQGDWLLQLECFDPHEPFEAPERFRQMFGADGNQPVLDWPRYAAVQESPEEVARIRASYSALVAMCDEYFGRLLDWMDANDSWNDTALILTTDHGYLLGEHEWWAKNKMPYYEEISHLPLMIWQPSCDQPGQRIGNLTQTTDLMPTLLDLHGVAPPPEARAQSLTPMLQGNAGDRESALIGMFGGPVCVTDGHYSYFRFPVTDDPAALPMYTLMPSHLEEMFSPSQLATAQLSPPFDFTKGAPLLRIFMQQDGGECGHEILRYWDRGNVLFDLSRDPGQVSPIDDPQTERRMIDLIIAQFVAHDAPVELYAHFALPDPSRRSPTVSLDQ